MPVRRSENIENEKLFEILDLVLGLRLYLSFKVTVRVRVEVRLYL